MEDFLPAWITDPYTRQVVMAIGALIVMAVLWFVWRFFFSLFKYVVIGIFLFVASGAVYWWMNSSTPERAPEVGKHAYGAISKRYLGKVQSVVNDGSRGITLGVRAPGGTITSYPKESIVLRDEMIAVEPTATPASSPTPTGTLKPARSRPRS